LNNEKISQNYEENYYDEFNKENFDENDEGFESQTDEISESSMFGES
jgi:hypothetical protein